MRPVRDAGVAFADRDWRTRSDGGSFAAMRNAIFALALVGVAACQSSDVSRQVGARCDHSSECDELCLGPSADWPGGFCSISCDSDEDCPSDASCVQESNSAVCAFHCLTDPGCSFLGQGYLCKERDRQGATGKVTVCRGS
jgi:hypothetical protein